MTKIFSSRSAVYLLAGCWLLWGCARQMEVVVEFEAINGLESGAPVYLDQQRVGKVKQIRQQLAAFTVSLALDPEKSAVLRRGSAAMIVERDGMPAVVLHNTLLGKEPLTGGARLHALNSPLEFPAWQTGEAMEHAGQSLQQVLSSLDQYLESE